MCIANNALVIQRKTSYEKNENIKISTLKTGIYTRLADADKKIQVSFLFDNIVSNGIKY